MQTFRPTAQVGSEPATTTPAPEPADELFDLTDRRRVLLRLLFAIDVADADEVFEVRSRR